MKNEALIKAYLEEKDSLINNLENEVESVFSGCWKEFRITNYNYQESFICPSLDVY